MESESSEIPSKPAVEVLLEAGQRLAINKESVLHIGGNDYGVVVPDGENRMRLLDLKMPDHAKAKPLRKLGTVHVDDIDSFIEFFKLHAEKDSAAVFISVNSSGAQFVGVMNAHGKDANHGDHRVIYNCKQSVEWQRWMAKNAVLLEQQAFIEHLEVCADLITKPAGTDLIALLQNLQGKNNANFKQAYNQFNGQFSVEYDEDIVVSGSATTKPGGMKVPSEISLLVPPFENSAAYVMKARLKLRVANRKLSFFYETVNPHTVIKHVVEEMRKTVSEKLKVPTLLGSAPTV